MYLSVKQDYNGISHPPHKGLLIKDRLFSICVYGEKLYIWGARFSSNKSIYPITLHGRWGTTDDFTTTLFHLVLSSAALAEVARSISVPSLILSSHLFFCLPLYLFPFTVPCRTVFTELSDLETWPNHLSFCFLSKVRSSSYSFCKPPHW